MVDLKFIQWKGHSECLQQCLKDSFEKQLFCDLTILCEGQVFKGHKIILSSFSGLIQKAIEPCIDTCPTIVLCGIEKTFLEGLLELIYTGKVDISRHELQDFAKAADVFELRYHMELKGLLDPEVLEESLTNSPGKINAVKKTNLSPSPKEKPLDTVKTVAVTKKRKSCENKNYASPKNNKDTISTYQHKRARNLSEILLKTWSSGSNSEDDFEGWDPENLSTGNAEKIVTLAFQCTFCEEEFLSEEERFKHFMHTHSKLIDSHSCMPCEEIFLSANDCSSHKKDCKHNRSSNFSNNEKHVLFKSSINVRKSSPRKSKKDMAALQDALSAVTADFFNDVKVDDHQNEMCYDELDTENSIKDNQQLLECQFCLKLFKKEKEVELDLHEKSHCKSSKPYSCPYCLYETRDIITRDNHMKKHKINKQFLCTQCSFTTESDLELSTHTVNIHGSENEF